jgi:hypothetical protein
MTKSLGEMSDAQLFAHGAMVLGKMCDSMKESHLRLAAVFVYPDDGESKLATVLLRHSLRPCLDGVGHILNSVDLIDEEVADLSRPLFLELRRRFAATDIASQLALKPELMDDVEQRLSSEQGVEFDD